MENQAIGVETARPNQPLQQQTKITIKEDSSIISGMIRLIVLKVLNCLCKNSCVFSGFSNEMRLQVDCCAFIMIY